MKRILICLLIYGLWTMDYGLLYAQNAKVRVSADVTTQTTTLDPQASAPASPVEGQIYYNNTADQFYYYDGTDWRPFGGSQNKTVATSIVAAYNSSGSTQDGTPAGPLCLGNGSACINPKADRTCTGTNDQQTIQQAIDDLGASPGVVYLLEGTYNISGSINLNNTAPDDSGKAIIGAGVATLLRLASGSNVNIINAQNVSRVLISQLKIDGNSKTGSNNNGIYFNSVTYSKIDKVWVGNMASYGVYFFSSSNNTASGNNVQSNGSYGVYFYTSSNNTVSGNNLQSNYYGIYFYSSSNNTVSGNSVQSSVYHGIRINDYSSDNTVSGNNVQSSGTNGILISSSSNNTVSGNNVQSSSSNGIWIQASSNNTVSNNNVQSNAFNGIWISTITSNNNIVSGNVIYNNGGTGVYSGISISNSSTNLISSNLLYDSSGTGYPIDINTADCDNNYLVGNHISSWPAGYGRINDTGTNTKYTAKQKITLERSAVLTVSSGSTIGTTATLTSYLPIRSSGGAVTANAATPIVAGKAAGGILVLEGTDNVNTVNIPDSGNVKLQGACLLDQNNTLSLIWDGTFWIETGRSAN